MYMYIYIYIYIYIHVSHWVVGRPAVAPQNLPGQGVFWSMIHLLQSAPDSARRASFSTLVCGGNMMQDQLPSL